MSIFAGVHAKRFVRKVCTCIGFGTFPVCEACVIRFAWGGGVGGLCKFTLASGMQPPDCTYLQLLPDGSDCALMCMILTPGSSCTSGLFDDVNGVDTVIDTTACTTPKTAENNADTPDTVFALTQPGVTKADCEIDAVHAGASALVAAVRAGHISPTIRTTRRLVSKVTPQRKAQKVSQHQSTRYPIGYVTGYPSARAARDSVHSDILSDILAAMSPRHLQDSASCGGATFVTSALSEIRDTDLNEDVTWESNCHSNLTNFWDVFLDDADDLMTVFNSMKRTRSVHSDGFFEED